MKGKNEKVWFISPKSFVNLIGAEYDLLKRSGSGSLTKFYISAVVIMMILVISSLSIYYAMDLLFHVYEVEIALAIFVSVLFVFIYIFLINTFSKGLFHTNSPAGRGISFKGIRMSDAIRTGFVIFMAFIISKPIGTYVLRKDLDAETAVYKSTLINNYIKKLDSLSFKEETDIKQKISFYQEQLVKYPSLAMSTSLSRLQLELQMIAALNNGHIALARNLVDHCDFLLFRIKRAGRYPITWLISFLLILIFLLPGYLIYSISANDSYFKMKKEKESELITEEYAAFLHWYSQVFSECYDLNISFYSPYEDPPFNTRLRPAKPYMDQGEFINKYLNLSNGL